MQQKKKTFILSNTNPIHIQEVRRRFHQAVTDYQFESLFEKIYYSYEVGLHKPDIKIFDYVVKDSNLNPEKTLFIDDNKNNILSATQYGLKTIYMNPKMNLPKIFF
nr:HAD-IA family hydrolase [Geminocystis sp. GBBB08]